MLHSLLRTCVTGSSNTRRLSDAYVTTKTDWLTASLFLGITSMHMNITSLKMCSSYAPLTTCICLNLRNYYSIAWKTFKQRMAEWLRRLTRKPKVRTAVGSSPTLDSLVAVRNSSPGQPEPCEGNLVAAAGSCHGLIIKHPWPLLEISLSDFHGLATLNVNTYLATC